MEFLIANQDLIFIFGVIIGVLGIGFLFKWLKNKNYIDESDVELSKDLLILAQLILTRFNFRNENTTENLNTFFNVADVVVDFIVMNFNVVENDEISNLAYDTSLKVLDYLNINIDSEKKEMIRKGIDFAVRELNGKVE